MELKPGMAVIMGSEIIKTNPDKTVTTNEIKKGHRIMQRNGWFGTMVDNARGTIRMAEVEGYVTEMGSIYAHDIVLAQIDDVWYVVEHTKAQLELKKRVERMM